MCGLVAVISPKSQTLSENNIFKQMLVMDQLRGKDSTGIFAVNANAEASIAKSIATPADFLQLTRVSSMINTAHILVGHNRHATIGAVNTNNAHPFQHNNITLVHNGTLDKCPKLPHQDEFDTDSEAVCYNLSLCNSDEETHKFLESLEGAFAFIWYDDVEEATYFIRNDERPLYRVHVGDSMMLASERGFLFAALDRNNVSISSLDVFSEVPSGVLHKVTKDAQGKLTVEVQRLTLKKFFRQDYYMGYQSGSGANYGSKGYITDLEAELGIKPGTVLPAVVARVESYPNAYTGTVYVRLNQRGFDSLVICYGISNVDDFKAGDKVSVMVNSLDLHLFGNRTAHSTFDITARGNNLKKTFTPAVIEGGKQDTDVELSDTDTDDAVICMNCDLPTAPEDASELTDGTHICKMCLKHDDEAQLYCQNKLVS